jgi:serine/threonine protein kinase
VRAGDMLNGYTLLADFSVVGAGLSRWTFASKGGREYFLKEFLSPTYPEADAPGSEKIKAKKRARCAVFETQHRSMQAALAPLSAYGGNLIVTHEFFRAGAKYYKTTERVDAENFDVARIAALPFRQRLVLLKSVAHSLKILHDLNIVHGDLKPDNVLVKRTELGYTSKLIDFDNSYVAGRPPAATEIVGTINYYSPELLSYIQEEGVEGAHLGTASDVFALGLIYSEFLTGRLPEYDPAYGEPAVAARSGVVLKVDRTGLDPALADLVDRMMLATPAARPAIGEVHAALMGIRGSGEPPAATVPRAPSGALRGKLVGAAAAPVAPVAPAAPAAPRSAPTSAPTAPVAPAAPIPGPASGLKGKLIRRTPREDRS